MIPFVLDIIRTRGLKVTKATEMMMELIEIQMTGAYLSQFHHHVSKDVEEAHDGIPQPAVGQGLLVARAWALRRQRFFFFFFKRRSKKKKKTTTKVSLFFF